MRWTVPRKRRRSRRQLKIGQLKDASFDSSLEGGSGLGGGLYGRRLNNLDIYKQTWPTPPPPQELSISLSLSLSLSLCLSLSLSVCKGDA
jgi:hypothetical protein